jgi:hypothetical protein
VPRRLDDLEGENAVTVADRDGCARRADRGDVGGSGVGRRVGSLSEHLRQAADVVAMRVREDNVAHCAPSEVEHADRRLDLTRAARDACVDHRRLAVAGQHVGGDHDQRHAPPFEGAGGRVGARGRRRGRGGGRGRRGRWRRDLLVIVVAGVESGG